MSEMPASSQGRILIVDDSENIRSVLQMNFEHLGYEVLSAKDGEEALRLVSERVPDVVVLDVMMPRQNGFQVCRRLKSDPATAHIPVIFLSAKGQKEDRFWGKDCGADEYLTKPFSAAELERIIERLLEGRPRDLTQERFEEEISEYRKRGGPFSLLTLTYDPRALLVFRQKHGELRFREALDGIRQTVQIVAGRHTGEGLVWMTGDNTLRAILPGSIEESRALRDRLVMQIDLLLNSFYSDSDVSQGYVVVRGGADGGEIHVPLLRTEADLHPEGPPPSIH